MSFDPFVYVWATYVFEPTVVIRHFDAVIYVSDGTLLGFRHFRESGRSNDRKRNKSFDHKEPLQVFETTTELPMAVEPSS